MSRLVSRREFVRIGSLLVGGLTLPDLLRQRAQAGSAEDETAVIFVSLGGGASQFETYDPKPDAPAEYRGPTAAIRTRVPGTLVSELLPEQARIMDKLTIVRSVGHRQASHIALHIVETGYDLQSSQNARAGEMPSVGAVVSRVRGAEDGLPAFVSVPRPQAYSGAHWLGAQHNYFAVNGDPNAPDFQIENLALVPGMTAGRLADRRELLSKISSGQAIDDQERQADALDEFHSQAFELMTGSKAQRAFDLDREDARLRERYGRNKLGQQLLLARRLVEAGVPFVHVRTFDWDDHTNLEVGMRRRCPAFDSGLATLVEDLEQRGLRERVLVVALGEFGRTPRINVNAGRDHWPAVASVLFAGGSYGMGRVIGASDATGARVVAAPYGPQNVLAMVYRHLGIDPALTFADYSGRPRHVLEERRPIAELL